MNADCALSLAPSETFGFAEVPRVRLPIYMGESWPLLTANIARLLDVRDLLRIRVLTKRYVAPSSFTCLANRAMFEVLGPEAKPIEAEFRRGSRCDSRTCLYRRPDPYYGIPNEISLEKCRTAIDASFSFEPGKPNGLFSNCPAQVIARG